MIALILILQPWWGVDVTDVLVLVDEPLWNAIIDYNLQLIQLTSDSMKHLSLYIRLPTASYSDFDIKINELKHYSADRGCTVFERDCKVWTELCK